MTLVTFCSDDKYLYLLRPFLQSISEQIEQPKVFVIYYEYSLSNLYFLERVFPFVRFIKEDRKSDNPTYINSGRLHHYLDILETLEKDSDIVYIDCDTIILKDFSDIFDKDFDAAFTYKEDKFPLNFGVICGRNNASFKETIKYICETVDNIFLDDNLLAEATRLSGAADQHSINALIHAPNKPPAYETYTEKDRDGTFGKRYNIEINGINIKMDFFPCTIYNETECKPISDELKVIHYKSGWHPILKEIHKPKYSKYRSEEDCREMFNYWASFNNKAVESYFSFIFSGMDESVAKLIKNKCETSLTENKINILVILAMCKKLDIKSIVIMSKREKYLQEIILSYTDNITILTSKDIIKNNSLVLIDDMGIYKSSRIIKNNFIVNKNILLNIVISTSDVSTSKSFINNFILMKTLNISEFSKYFDEIFFENEGLAASTLLKENLSFILPDGNNEKFNFMESSKLAKVLRVLSRICKGTCGKILQNSDKKRPVK